jgi:hypothetical protein
LRLEYGVASVRTLCCGVYSIGLENGKKFSDRPDGHAKPEIIVLIPIFGRMLQSLDSSL